MNKHLPVYDPECQVFDPVFRPVFLLLNFGLLYATNLTKIFSHLFSCRIFENKRLNSARVVPIERDDVTIEEGSAVRRSRVDSEVGLDNNPLGNIYDLLKLDPRNKENLFGQIDRCKIAKIDRLSNLDFYLLNYIIEYLDFESNLNFRAANRRLLINQIETSRYKFYKDIGLKISSGFECFHHSTLSAVYFNRLGRPIHYLLSKDHRTIKRYYYCNRPDGAISNDLIDDVRVIEENLDIVTSLKKFLILSLDFYRRTDLRSFWELLEALMKIKAIKFSKGFNYYNGFDIEDIFSHACKLGHLCIVKSLIEDPKIVKKVNLYTGSSIALSSNYFNVFKVIVKKLYSMDFDENSLTNLFEIAVLQDKLEYVKFLLESFDVLYRVDSSILFFAIRNQNIKMIELIIQYKGVSFLREGCYFNLCALELAAKFNFHDGVKYFLTIQSQKDLSIIGSAIKFSIQFNSFESLQILIDEITQTGALNEIYSKQTVSSFVSSTILYKNIKAMKFILSKLSVKTMEELGLMFDGSIHSKLSFCNLFHYAVQYDFERGFDVLVEHFGTEALKEIDGSGKTPFLLAISNRNLYFALKIAGLKPESVSIPDTLGNNALHLMISYGYPSEFIKQISDLDLIDWETQNFALFTPYEILKSVTRRFTWEYYHEISQIIFTDLNK